MNFRSVCLAGASVALAAAPSLADGGAGIGGAAELNYDVLTGDLAALADIARYVAGAMGFGLVGFGLLNFLQRQGQQMPVGRSLAMILVGGVLLSVPAALNMAAGSIFGADNMTLVGVESHVADVGPAKAMFTLLLQISWVVGFIGFISGWKSLTNKDPLFWTSVVRIVAGSCAMNAAILLNMMSQWGGVFAGIKAFIK